MCDYSIEGSANTRDAVVGDKLVSTKFNAHTRGFSGVNEPNIAVCVKPGTEIQFEKNVKISTKTYLYRSIIEDISVLFSKMLRIDRKTIKATTAVFRQAQNFIYGSADTKDNLALMNAYQVGGHRHRDALEFPDGQVVLLTNLVPGQRAIVLQLPVKETPKVEPKEVYTGESCSNIPAPELETVN